MYLEAAILFYVLGYMAYTALSVVTGVMGAL